MTNKEKQIIKELRKIAKYGILTDADGDFTEFYFKDIEELFSKALKSQREDIVEKIEKYFNNLQTRIPLPDPITMKEEIKIKITKEDE